jgi:RNA polymerase sigma factor (sigma-70 family)
MPPDSELLLRYARDCDESAFAELVRSHIDLIYSAALRRVGGDAHAASEITQDVFLAMARHAEHLSRHPVLNAWLHTSTRNAAANLRRRDHRRERQKQALQAMHTLDRSDPSPGEWQAIRDTLDAALDELNDTDRQAIILRFFESQSYPDMGARLGLKEETARMRVARALEKLRARLARRGIVSTSAIIGGALASHVIVAAPPGLAATVTAAVTTSAAVVAAPAVGLIPLMSTTKLLATLAAVAAIMGVAALVNHRSAPQASAPSRPPIASQALTAPGASGDTRKDGPSPMLESAFASSPAAGSREREDAAEKIAALRAMLARLPEQSIPELKLATYGDWTIAVDGSLETPEDFRRALGKIRSAAERRFAQLVHPALRAYLQANGNQFPTDPLQLHPFASPDIDRAMLLRYKLVPSTEISNVKMGGDWAITQVARIDSDYDSTTVIGPHGVGATDVSPFFAKELATIRPLIKAYEAAHGRRHTAIMELLPLANTPQEKAVILEWERRSQLPR